MYEAVDPKARMTDISKEILDYWKKNGIEEESLMRKGKKKFIFLEGPPTANGRPHLGHLMTRTFKDSIMRYKSMNGFTIIGRSGGWDCHGLPVEIETEKSLGLTNKNDIVNFGIGKFNDLCRKSVFRYIEEWKYCDEGIGLWIDHSKDYITLRDEYIESEWWALSSLFKRGDLYKDFKIVPYCPRCGTSLSSHEVAQGYEEVSDPSVYVKFHLLNHHNRYLVAWTTTPWTLPSNQFLAVSENEEYSVVLYNNQELVVASSLLGQVFSGSFTVVERMHGSDLVGLHYEQLIPFIPVTEKSLRVVSGDFVGMEEGTGIVHIAPAFGADDFEIGRRENIDPINPVDLQGRFNDPRLPWNGMYVKDADPEIIKFLKEQGSLLKSTKVKHTYPFCYRCGNPLLYYPLEAWFIRVSKYRKDLMGNNDRINWIPSFLKYGRFGNFLEEAKDWDLSRNRFWGTPLPAWTCPNNHTVFVESREDLLKRSGKSPENLHRPFVDDITFKCEKCGEEMKREPYVIDTWFDSGSAPYASVHYPFSSHELRNLPVDFITEAVDQTRGWYYVLHAISTLLFNRNAYRNVLTIEFVLDQNGKKMSKSAGNSVYAKDVIEEIGPDPLRLFFFNGAPWKTRNFDLKLITELSRKNLYTLLNVYSFFASNAALDHFQYNGEPYSENPLDKWILSLVNRTMANVKKSFDSYVPHESLSYLQNLIDKLSNYYLRLSRMRFWSSDTITEKNSAYSTLYYALLNTVRMMAPITPFFSEFIYLRMTDGRSVHLEQFPEPDSKYMNDSIEKDFDYAILIIEKVRKLRQTLNIKGRQPVTEILVLSSSYMDERIQEIIKNELNTKSLRFISKEDRPVSVKADLDVTMVGRTFREKAGVIRKEMEEMDQAKLLKILARDGKIKVGDTYVGREFFRFSEIPHEEYGMEKDEKTGTEIFIDKRINRDLLLEGISREIIRRIQVMRKEMNLNYDDRIIMAINGDGDVLDTLGKFGDRICSETLGRIVNGSSMPESTRYQKEWTIDDMKVTIAIIKDQ